MGACKQTRKLTSIFLFVLLTISIFGFFKVQPSKANYTPPYGTQGVNFELYHQPTINNFNNATFTKIASWNVSIVRVTFIEKNNVFPRDNLGNDLGLGVITDAVTWTKDNGLDIIINYYDVTTGGVRNFVVDKAHWITQWEWIANEFKNETHVIYEIMNEPWGLEEEITLSDWNTYNQDCVDAIRVIDSNTPILIDSLNSVGTYKSGSMNAFLDAPITGTNIWISKNWYANLWNMRCDIHGLDYESYDDFETELNSSRMRWDDAYNAGYKMFIGEFAQHQWLIDDHGFAFAEHMFKAMNKFNMTWCAWWLFVTDSGTGLITDWTSMNPTDWGTYVQDNIEAEVGGDPPPPPPSIIPFADGFESNDFSKWNGTNTNGGGTCTISSTAYAGSYSGNFTSLTGQWSRGYAFLDFSNRDYFYAVSHVWFDSLPSDDTELMLVNFGSDSDWIAQILYRESSGYAWKVQVHGGGAWSSAQTIDIHEDYTIELFLNLTGSSSDDGRIQFWVDEVLLIDETGDFDDYGQITKVTIGIENNNAQEQSRTVLHDDVRLDNTRIGAGEPLFFSSDFYVYDEGGIGIPNVNINGTNTNEEGWLQWSNLTYNTVYTFVVEAPQDYYPAWILNVDGSVSWNGSHYILSHNLTETQTGYLQIFFLSSTNPYVNYTDAKLTSVSFTSISFSIVANDTGTKTIEVATVDRGEPLDVSGASYSWNATIDILTLTVTFSSQESITISWGSDVGTSLSAYATGLNYQRKTFYANERFWVFYSDGQDMVFRSSTDGSTWGNSTVFESDSSSGLDLSLYFSDPNVHFAYRNGSTGKLNYRRGQPQSNGTITFDPIQELNQIGVARAYIALDLDGYPWIASHNASHLLVWKSSLSNGSWTTDASFPYILSGSGLTPLVVQYSNYMYLIYAEQGEPLKARRYSGTWSGEETISGSQVVGSGMNQDNRWSLTSDNSTIHIVFPYTTKIFHVAFDGDTWTPPFEVISHDQPQTEAILSMSGSIAYLFWETGGIIYLRRYVDEWEQTKLWLSESTNKQTISSSFTSHSNRIGLIWTTGSFPQSIVKFAWFYTTTSGNFLLEGYDGVTLSSIVYDDLEGKLTFTSMGSGFAIVRGTDTTLTVLVNGSAWSGWSSDQLYVTILALSGTSNVTLYSVINNFPSSDLSERDVRDPLDVIEIIKPIIPPLSIEGLFVVFGGVGVFVVGAFYTKFIRGTRTRGISKPQVPRISKPRGIQHRTTPRKRIPKKPKKAKRSGRFIK